MKQAIQYSCDLHHYLSMTPRKKNSCNTLLILKSGTVLIRLGKFEHLLSAGEAFWIPFDCLHALTILPNSQLITVSFSVRLTDPFTKDTGYLTPSALITALCDKIDSLGEDSSRFHKHLLQVIRDEATQFVPTLNIKQDTIALSSWINTPFKERNPLKLNSTPLSSSELSLVLAVRESIKMRKSGMTMDKVVTELFNGDLEAYQQSLQCVLGEAVE
ncbi:hypothetical protein [Aliivibrio kagoshimensis]|uniref:hypothetical protein n=1 Tax=Aliivibrio kagoshimensis TaxID=2910230 RepID=UPI003D0C0E00